MTKLDKAEIRARNILFWLFFSNFIIDCFVVATSPRNSGIVRLILTLLLMYFVFQGHRWAKWYVIVSTFVGVIVAIIISPFIFKDILMPQLIIVGAFFLIWVGINLTIAIFLLRNKAINRYFEYKRKTRLP